jgi:ABC-2 type transport system permease protein
MISIAASADPARAPRAPRVVPVRGPRAAALLAATLFRQHMIVTRHYYFNLITALISSYAFFFMIFMGVSSAYGAGSGAQQALSEVVVRMMIWILCSQGFVDLANGIANEASQGTLEQVAMSPFGMARVLLARVFSRFLVQYLFSLALLVLMMATTGHWMRLHLLSITPLLVLTAAGAYGIGLVIGGVTLVFKRTNSTFGVLQYLLMGLIAIPRGKFEHLELLPLSLGSHLVREVMIEGTPLTRLPAADLAMLVANTVAYLGAGYLVFQWFERRARDLGTLGHY